MFLKTLYQRWRFMFYLVMFFIVAQAFFMYKAVETIPFFLFNMYSTRQKAADTSYRTTIYINDKEFSTDHLISREKETLLGSLSYFNILQRNDFYATDPAIVRRRFKNVFPGNFYKVVEKRLTNSNVNDQLFYNWWSCYLSRVSGQKVDSFSIVKSRVIGKPVYRHLNDTLSVIHHVVGK